MPFVTIKAIKGVFNEIQKQAIMEGITNVITRVAEGEDSDFQDAVWVMMEEAEPAHWSLGGKKPNPELQMLRSKHDENKQ